MPIHIFYYYNRLFLYCMITYVKIDFLYVFVYNCIFCSLLVYLNKSSSKKERKKEIMYK